MRLRSYYVSALSSFLIFLASCLAQPTNALEDKEGPLRTLDPSSVADKDNGSEGALREVKKTSLHELKNERKVHVSSLDICSKGEMVFEGECLHKDNVEELLEKREQEALRRVKMAEHPEQVADAAHDLLEKQILQVDKAEDDLDEILEDLKNEQRSPTLANLKELVQEKEIQP